MSRDELDIEFEQIVHAHTYEECPRCLGRLRMVPLDPGFNSAAEKRQARDTPICRICRIDELMRWGAGFDLLPSDEWPMINGEAHAFVRKIIQLPPMTKDDWQVVRRALTGGGQ